MKQIYLLIALITTFSVSAQIPAGYYDSATGTGYTLKTQLKLIIDDANDGLSNEHIVSDQGYNALDVLYATSDLDNYYENDNTILDLYSENPSGIDPYNYTYGANQCGNYNSEGDCYNKEHVIPQSVFNQAIPMRSDAHHVIPTDGRVNGFRGNYPYGVAGTLVSQSGIANPTTNGSKLGNNLNSGYSAGYTGIVFEPIDEFKGDIARIYFYFVTRYETQIGAWGSYPMFDGSTTKVLADPFLNILYTWHINDPVSQKEIDRNNSIYTYQNNRNPFVDNPGYVLEIWQSALSVSSLEAHNITIYPNPVTGNTLTVDTHIPLKIEVYNVLGKKLISTNVDATSSKIDVGFLYSGVYMLKMTSEEGSITKRIIKQ